MITALIAVIIFLAVAAPIYWLACLCGSIVNALMNTTVVYEKTQTDYPEFDVLEPIDADIAAYQQAQRLEAQREQQALLRLRSKALARHRRKHSRR